MGIDEMYEAESARIWEEINTEKEIDKKEIASCLADAYEYLSDAYNRMMDAAAYAIGHPVYDEICSIMSEIDSLSEDARKISNRMKEEAQSA